MKTMRRTERFGMVMSPLEREGLRHLSELQGISEADVLRTMLRTAIEELPVELRQEIGWPAIQKNSLASR